jgi:nitrogen fixation/metabolism regulation signal transduction histidine kinase
VLGHELNNSLAPIKSLAGSLKRIVKQRGSEWEEDTERGLDIIATRAEGLSRFMEAYARLARLPPPMLVEAEIGAIVRRVVALEARIAVKRIDGPDVVLKIDPAQIEQLLINALKNAAEAALETGGSVTVSWELSRSFVEVRILDDGPGIANPSNLFVPFFTTKPGGTGIGLVLCRQVAENHGGSFNLSNRAASTGCEALLRLPAVTAGI